MKPAEFELDAHSERVRSALDDLRARAPGPAAERAVELAALLAQLRADEDVLLAALMVSCLDAGLIDETAATERYGPAAARLAVEVRRVGSIGMPADWRPGSHLKPQQAEGLRKLLLALAADVRLVLLRLALQLVRLRHLKEAPVEEQRRAALETREIYAPLANRLGIWQLKWELEDLAFRYCKNDEYKRIAGWLKSKRAERERWIEDVRSQLGAELERAGIAGQVTGRPKHIYSIWRKMQRK